MRSPTPSRRGRHPGPICALAAAVFAASFLVAPVPCAAQAPGAPESDVFNDSDDGPRPARRPKRSGADDPPPDETAPDEPPPDEPSPSGAATDDDDDDTLPADAPEDDAAAPAPPAAPKRLPVPSKEAVAEAEAAVRELFKAEYAKRGKADRVALARKLIDQADDAGGDGPAARYVLLREARDVAAAAGDAGVAMTAADRMIAAFAVKRAATKLAALPPNAAKGGDPVELARALVAITEAGIAEEDWDGATKAAALAAAAAGRVRDDKALALRARSQPGAVTRSRKLAAAAAEARKALAANPKDPKANLLLGRYLCLTRRDWAAGVPHLARSGDPVLAGPAGRELKAATGGDAKAMAEAAGGWWSAAEKAAKDDAGALRARAAHWYRRAAPELEGVTKSLAEKRLAEVRRDSQVTSANLLLRMEAQGCTAKRAQDGVALSEGEHGRIVTPDEYHGPVTFEVVAKTLRGNMRFYAGDRGLCIFSWEGRPTELRFHDPATGHGTAVPSKGAIPDGQWVTVRWVIDADETSIFVNDQLRHRAKGNYSDWSGVFGIGPSQGSVVTVRSVTVTSVPAEAE